MIVPLLLAALTIDEAVVRALQNNPEVGVARAARVIASAKAAVARAIPAPEFRMSIGSFDADPETVKERTTIGLRYSPPRPREMALKQALAQAQEKSASAEIRVAEARAAAEVRLAFRRAVMAQNRTALAERLVELRKNKRRTLLRQVSAGIKESDEKDIADLDVEEAENALRKALSMARAEKTKLGRLIDPSGLLKDDLVMDPAMVTVPVSISTSPGLIELALTGRAELEVIDGTCREYELEGKRASSERYPWISFVEVSHRVTYLPDRGPWGWKFGVDLPFFRSAAAAEAKLAEAQHARCRIQHRAMASKIRSEVEAVILNLEEIRRELLDVDRLRSGPGERALQRAQNALRAGRADQIDVFDAEARLLTIQDRWLERRLQYVDLESQLESALGAPLSTTHNGVITNTNSTDSTYRR